MSRDNRVEEIQARYGTFGGREIRTVPFVVEEVRDSGAGKGQFTVRGHAAVFNNWSLDLGGFRERILPGAFDGALSEDPHVLHLWDHDSRYVLSSTRNKTLELRVDPAGLHFWSRVAPTSYAEDLRILLERGDIGQSSFAFSGVEDDWRVVEENGVEVVERDIARIGELYDVTTTAMGAYPTTDSSVVAERALSYARSTGRLPDIEEEPAVQWVGRLEDIVPPEELEPVVSLADIRRQARHDAQEAKRRYLALDRRLG